MTVQTTQDPHTQNSSDHHQEQEEQIPTGQKPTMNLHRRHLSVPDRLTKVNTAKLTKIALGSALLLVAIWAIESRVAMDARQRTSAAPDEVQEVTISGGAIPIPRRTTGFSLQDTAQDTAPSLPDNDQPLPSNTMAVPAAVTADNVPTPAEAEEDEDNQSDGEHSSSADAKLPDGSDASQNSDTSMPSGEEDDEDEHSGDSDDSSAGESEEKKPAIESAQPQPDVPESSGDPALSLANDTPNNKKSFSEELEETDDSPDSVANGVGNPTSAKSSDTEDYDRVDNDKSIVIIDGSGAHERTPTPAPTSESEETRGQDGTAASSDDNDKRSSEDDNTAVVSNPSPPVAVSSTPSPDGAEQSEEAGQPSGKSEPKIDDPEPHTESSDDELKTKSADEDASDADDSSPAEGARNEVSDSQEDVAAGSAGSVATPTLP